MVKWSCGSALSVVIHSRMKTLPNTDFQGLNLLKKFTSRFLKHQNGTGKTVVFDGIRLTSSHLPEIIVPTNQLDFD